MRARRASLPGRATRAPRAKLMITGDEVGAIVLDAGSYQTRIGYAGLASPSAVFPSAMSVSEGGAAGTAPHGFGERVSGQRRFRLGLNALSFPTSGDTISSPFDDEGLVDDWDMYESLLDYGFSDVLNIEPKEHPLLLSEPVHNTDALRAKATELAFEKYTCPGAFMCKSPVLAAFQQGKHNALSVDFGYQHTTITPVHDGYALRNAVHRVPLGGCTITEELLRLLTEAGHTLVPLYRVDRVLGRSLDVKGHRSMEEAGACADYEQWALRRLVRDVKEAVCSVPEHAFQLAVHGQKHNESYTLPDGTALNVAWHRWQAVDVLFQPTLLGSHDGLPVSTNGAVAMDTLPGEGNTPTVGVLESMKAAIDGCDPTFQQELYRNVVLSGGTACLRGMKERVKTDLKQLIGARADVFMGSDTAEVTHGVWLGGTILGSLGTFQHMWMSKSEYDEHGSGLVRMKC